jgi:hypothetical protein
MKHSLIALLCLVLTSCATARRHPLRVGIIVGVGTAIAIDLATRHHCDHYPPGESGVGVDCPHEVYHGK